MLHDYATPAFGFQRFFTLTPFSTQYLSVYFSSAWLASAVGVVAALKLVLAASLAALPYSLRALLRVLGKPPHYALLALPLTYNSQLILGFLNFIAGLPLLFWGLKLALEQRARVSLRAALLLAAVALGCFFTHVVPFAILLFGAALLSWERDFRLVLRRLWPFAPSLLAFAVWSRCAPAGRAFSGLIGGSVTADTLPLGTRLAELPLWLTDVLPGAEDELALGGFALCVLLVVVARRSPPSAPLPGSRRLLLLAPAAALAYFVLPSSAGFIWPIHARFALLTLLLLIPALPPAAPRLLPGIAALALLAAASDVCGVFRAFRRVDADETVGLPALLEELPWGARVAGLIFDPSSRYLAFSPFLHAVAWAQVERGGAVMFTFADFPASPFRFRAQNRPPAVPPRWEWRPAHVDSERELGFYDYVLTRRAPRSLPGWRRVRTAADWALWRPEAPRAASAH